MNKTLQYCAKNQAEHDSILFLLEKYGFRSPSYPVGGAKEYIENHGFSFPWIAINLNDKNFGGNTTYRESRQTVTLFELLLILNGIKNRFLFPLNDEYDAEIVEGQDFVTVGCQKIEVKRIVELVAKLEEMKCLPLTK